MTEQEWLTHIDPQGMLTWLNVPTSSNMPGPPGISERKQRLFACACVRQVWPRLTDERSRRAVEVAERYADGLATKGEVDAAGREGIYVGLDRHAIAFSAVRCAETYEDYGSHVDIVMRSIGKVVPPATLAALLRDVVGNPWHPHLPSGLPGDHILDERVCERCGRRFPKHPGLCTGCGSEFIRKWRVRDEYPWLTLQVNSLAEVAYLERRRREVCRSCSGEGCGGNAGRLDDPGERCDGSGERWVDDGTLDPARLAVLADALEESGCTDEPLLRHLRGLEACFKCRGTGIGGDNYQDWNRGGRRVTCNQCDSTGWRPKRGPCVRGCHVLDLFLGRK